MLGLGKFGSYNKLIINQLWAVNILTPATSETLANSLNQNSAEKRLVKEFVKFWKKQTWQMNIFAQIFIAIYLFLLGIGSLSLMVVLISMLYKYSGIPTYLERRKYNKLQKKDQLQQV